MCEAWPVKTWNKLRKSLSDARLRSIQRGRQHWTAAFFQFEALITNRPASTAASSGPGSEISSVDDFSIHNQGISTKGPVYGDF